MLCKIQFNYELANFIVALISAGIAVLAFFVGTGISWYIFHKNRKNYTSKTNKKIEKLKFYVSNSQYSMRIKNIKYKEQKQNQKLNLFYSMEYVIMEYLYTVIGDSKGFITWEKFNVIDNLIKSGKKQIKFFMKVLNLGRKNIELIHQSIDEFRIVLFINGKGVAFDLYGQFIDNNFLNQSYKHQILNDNWEELNLFGRTRPYNILDILDQNYILDQSTIEDKYGWEKLSNLNYNLQKKLNFTFFPHLFSNSKWNDFELDLPDLLEKMKK